jgi:hypothetical protein
MLNRQAALLLLSLLAFTVVSGCSDETSNDPGRTDLVINNTSNAPLTVTLTLQGAGATQVATSVAAGARTIVATNLAGEGVTEPPSTFATRLQLVTDDDRNVVTLDPLADSAFVSARLGGLREEFVLTVTQAQVDAAQ